MPVHCLQPVTDVPSSTLTSWSVFETASGDRHLCGYSTRDREGRVTSALVAFDPAAPSFTTSSGRVYRLVGAPGHDPDAEYVQRRWLAINGSPSTTDVTQAVWQEVQGARAGGAAAGDSGATHDAAKAS